MENTESRIEKFLSAMIYGSLMILALGLLTSTTLLALSHILMAVPALYFLVKGDYRNLPKSAWALLALTAVIVISVLVNQDIAIKGYKPAFKAKYFLIGFLSVVPITWYFKNHYNEKKVSYLLYAFCLSTTIATLLGFVGLFLDYIPFILPKVHAIGRNGGVFGMLMNYAHNLSFFLIIVVGLLVFRDETKRFISTKFLFVVFVINFLGLYTTYTRGALLALFIGVPFYFLKHHKRIFFIICGCAVFIGVAGFYFSGDKLYRPESDAERISQWKAAMKAFEERPVFGYGYLNFEEHSIALKKKYNIEGDYTGGHAHSNYFEMLASTGMVGFTLFLVWLGLWFYEGYKGKNLVTNFTLPFIMTFMGGGLSQATAALGINLFFVMGAYAVSSAFAGKKVTL